MQPVYYIVSLEHHLLLILFHPCLSILLRSIGRLPDVFFSFVALPAVLDVARRRRYVRCCYVDSRRFLYDSSLPMLLFLIVYWYWPVLLSHYLCSFAPGQEMDLVKKYNWCQHFYFFLGYKMNSVYVMISLFF